MTRPRSTSFNWWRCGTAASEAFCRQCAGARTGLSRRADGIADHDHFGEAAELAKEWRPLLHHDGGGGAVASGPRDARSSPAHASDELHRLPRVCACSRRRIRQRCSRERCARVGAGLASSRAEHHGQPKIERRDAAPPRRRAERLLPGGALPVSGPNAPIGASIIISMTQSRTACTVHASRD